MPRRKAYNKVDSSSNLNKSPLLKQATLGFNTIQEDTRPSTRNNGNIQRNTSDTKSNNSFGKYGMSNKNKENTQGNVSNKRKRSTKKMSSSVSEESPRLKQTKLNYIKTSQNTRRSTRQDAGVQRNKSDAQNNNTFKKYGVYVPSYKDILIEKRNCDNYNELVEDLMESMRPLPSVEKLSLESQDANILVQDCKMVPLEDLRIMFNNNIEYLNQIQEGKIFSKRHNMYRNEAPTSEFTSISSMILFTDVQKQILVSLLCKTYGNSLVDYYFKVLLPELCLKIYIDEYGITYEEALQYLEDYPAVIKV